MASKRPLRVAKPHLILPLLLLAVAGCSGGTGAVENPAADPAVVSAERVQACEQAHGLSKASDAEWRTAPKEIGETSDQTRAFLFCEWPPSPGADPDGYSEISVRFAQGPNTASEWPIGPKAYRISSPNCQTFAVALAASGGTGYIKHLPAMIVSSNEIKTAEDEVWENDPQFSKLPFFPTRDEAVVLSNDHYTLDGVTCGEDSNGQPPEIDTTTAEGTTTQAPQPVAHTCPGFEFGVTIFAEVKASGVSCLDARVLLQAATLADTRAGQKQWTSADWTWKVQSVDELRSRITGSRGTSRISALWATE